MEWCKGDLHTHSVYSDGAYSVAEKVARAERARLDFMMLTDHHTAAQNHEITGAEPVLLVPGLEFGGERYGHSNLTGSMQPSPFPDGYRPSSAQEMRTAMGYAVENGLFVSINHPFDERGLCWEYGYDLPFHAIELWNGPWRCINAYALDWWTNQLRQGARLPIVGGSDIHKDTWWMYHGTPTTVAGCRAHTVSGIVEALKAGRCYITEAPDSAALEMHCGGAQLGEQATAADGRDVEITLTGLVPGDRLELVTAAGKAGIWYSEGDTLCAAYHACPGDRFICAQVWRSQSIAARYHDIDNEMIELLQMPTFSIDDWLVLIGNPIYFNL